MWQNCLTCIISLPCQDCEMCKKPDFRLVDDNPVFQACDGGSSSSFTPSVGVHERWPFGCTHLRQQLAKQFSRAQSLPFLSSISSKQHHHGLPKTSEAALWQGVVDVHLLARRYGGQGGHSDRSSHRTGFHDELQNILRPLHLDMFSYLPNKWKQCQANWHMGLLRLLCLNHGQPIMINIEE